MGVTMNIRNLCRTVTITGATLPLVMASAPCPAGLIGNAINKSLNSHGDGPVYYDHQESFKGLNQAVIGQFSVVFFTKKVDYDGGGFLSDGSSKAIGQLSGLAEPDYQKITDALYVQFKARLAAGGVTLVDPAAYYASKYHQKVTSEPNGHSVIVPLQDQDSADGVAYWPSELSYRENMAIALRMMDGHMRDVYTAQYAYAREAKVPVLNVVYVVDFAGPAKTEGGGVFQSINVTSQLAISPRGSQVQLMDASGKVGKIILNKPVIEGGDFADISDITSGLSKASQAASTAFNVFKGGLGALTNKGSRMDRRFQYAVTDPAAFAGMTVKAGTKTTDIFVQQLQTLR